jgi:hypothetical protein
VRFKKYAAILLALTLLCAPAGAEQAEPMGLIERQLSWYEFAPMPEAELSEAVGALGDIAGAYDFTGRTSSDGAYGYILGVLTAETSPLKGMQWQLYNPPEGGQLQGLWPGDIELGWSDLPTPAYTYKGVSLIFDPDAPDRIVVVPEKYVEFDYYALYNAVVYRKNAYLGDATSRGVSMCAPPAPYLLVRQFVNGEQREEYIRLTEDDVRNAMLSSSLYTPDVIGDYALTLFTQDGLELGDQKDVGVAAPLFDLAAKKCGFYVASPKDIGEIVSASIAVTAYGETNTQTVNDPKKLAQLEKILKNAKYSGTYSCPYTGVLTLTMADGQAVVIQKATDSCDTLIFGSAAGYQIGRKANTQFWEIFSKAMPKH